MTVSGKNWEREGIFEASKCGIENPSIGFKAHLKAVYEYFKKSAAEGVENHADRKVQYINQVKEKIYDVEKEITVFQSQNRELKSSISGENLSIGKLKDSKLDLETGKHIETDADKFNPTTYSALKVLLLFMGLLLLLFYVSTLDTAFFATATLPVGMKGNVMKQLIDPGKILLVSPWTIIMTLGLIAVLGFIGMYIHGKKNENKWKYLIYLGAFVFDFIIAYKVEQQLIESKILTSFNSNLKSDDFWGIALSGDVLTLLALGFFVYVIFSIALQQFLEQDDFKRAASKVEFQRQRQIEAIRERIHEHEQNKIKLESELEKNEFKIIEFQQKIKNLKEEINKIQNSKNETVTVDISELNEAARLIYKGWLQQLQLFGLSKEHESLENIINKFIDIINRNKEIYSINEELSNL